MLINRAVDGTAQRKRGWRGVMFWLALTTMLFSSLIVAAQEKSEKADEDEEQDTSIVETLTIVGTRSKPRTIMESPVPIDSFSSAEVSRQAHGDMTETLKNLVPSFSATPLTGDGSAFVRPTSLRGLPPDDLLVLVNGKRRHRSALIAHFGAAMNSGAHAVDIGMIPSIALKNAEVLRDGAAAQYGSDAIAGVLNFVYKDAREGAQVDVQYGEFFEGEASYKIAGNVGLPLFGDGFLNLSLEYTDNDRLVRGFEHAGAAAVIASGTPVVTSQAPYAMNWGRPESHGLRTVWNAGKSFGTSSVYFSGNYADTYGNYGFFYRAPDRSGVLTPVPIDPTDPSQGNFSWGDSFPGGFTPYLEGDSKDLSSVLGFRGAFDNGMVYDFSGSYGSNKMVYTLNETLNPSWGPDSPMVFNTGNLKQHETNLNADFSYPLGSRVNLAFGLEWREETYTMFEADAASWQAGAWANVGTLIDPVTGSNYNVPGNTSNGMPGIDPDAAGEFSRDNTAIYLDAEWDVSDALLIQGAIRFEDFSDFGTTTNGKLAARYSVSPKFALRGAVSSGFRAPTPGQSNYTGVVTTFDGATGMQTQQGTLRPTDPLSVSLGGKALEAEDAFNLSLGVTSRVNDSLSVTLDIYSVEVKDRIVKSQFLPVSDPTLDFTNLSFYTNSLETETEGADLVVVYDHGWSNDHDTNISFAWNYNKTDVVSQELVGGLNPVSDSVVFNIENNLPKNRISATAVHTANKLTAMLRFNYYGESVDERSGREEVGAETLTDVELGYQLGERLRLTLGVSNIFDNYPDEVDTRRSQGMPYPRRSPINYHGGMSYLRLVFNY